MASVSMAPLGIRICSAPKRHAPELLVGILPRERLGSARKENRKASRGQALGEDDDQAGAELACRTGRQVRSGSGRRRPWSGQAGRTPGCGRRQRCCRAPPRMPRTRVHRSRRSSTGAWQLQRYACRDLRTMCTKAGDWLGSIPRRPVPIDRGVASQPAMPSTVHRGRSGSPGRADLPAVRFDDRFEWTVVRRAPAGRSRV